MKTLKILAAFLFVTGAAVAQDINEAEVPTAVKNAFNKEYSNVNNVEWEKEMENYNVEFDSNRMENEIWYNASGNVLKKESDIAEADLPSSVSKAIKSKYAEYRIDGIEKVWQNNATTYEVELENGNAELHVTFDENAKVVSERKD